MVKLALQASGWMLAHLPEFVLRPFTWALGRFVWLAFGSRRRLVRSNLHHVFPERPAAWRDGLGRECMRRVVETALLSLALPYLPDERIRRIVAIDAGLRDLYARHRAQPHPILIGTPHMAHWEACTALPLVHGAPFPEIGAIYRPIDHPAADAWIKRTRERHGMRMLSRREGFLEATRVLARNGSIAVLFDQNSGQRGALTTLFGRVCSTTSMPGTLAAKAGAEVVAIYPRYRGFWRIEMVAEPVSHDGSIEGITTAFNLWLEGHLRRDENMAASWLWGHKRWKNQDSPAARLRLEQKQDFLAADLQRRGLSAPPRRTRLWVRLPNWLGDVAMAVPLLRAIRAGRPDAEITVLARPHFLPLLARFAVADRLLPLPPKGTFGYFRHFWRLRKEYPDCTLLFTNSARGDLEAWLTRCPQRFGIARRGRRRPLLTHRYEPAADFDETRHHQLELWTGFLTHFGLQATPDRTPFPPSTFNPSPRPSPAEAGQLSTSSPIGLICGSENNPEKRWPVEHWRRLIELRPADQFVLFGTAADRAITEAVASGFGERTTNLAGQTDLPTFAVKLAGCRLLVTNDTGGMHLANALGVPVIGLFGPTNPVRTGPVFTASAILLQPPGCPPTGGGRLADLAPETVAAAVAQVVRIAPDPPSAR